MNTVSTPPANDDIDHLARRRVKARLGWLTHAGVYLPVMTGLTVMAHLHGRHPPVAAALGWGLGVAVHGLRVLLAGSGWTDHLVDRERRRLAARRDAGRR